MGIFNVFDIIDDGFGDFVRPFAHVGVVGQVVDGRIIIIIAGGIVFAVIYWGWGGHVLLVGIIVFGCWRGIFITAAGQ